MSRPWAVFIDDDDGPSTFVGPFLSERRAASVAERVSELLEATDRVLVSYGPLCRTDDPKVAIWLEEPRSSPE